MSGTALSDAERHVAVQQIVLTFCQAGPFRAQKGNHAMDFRKRFEGLLTRPDQWEKSINGATPSGAAASPHLKETLNFGPNPGALRMFSYMPAGLPDPCPVLVVLHGCSQSAAGYDVGAGWSTLADRFKFAVLLPEQQRSNNPNGCFNWFQREDTQRGQGEAASIRQMVATMVANHGADERRIFVTGLSAGGAMASVMLATYPEVFAGGAIIAGLPYGAATNVQQALETMYQCRPRPAEAWGDLVRQASPHTGPWPRISVWHGGADATVVPRNAAEIIKQWSNVHGLPAKPSSESLVDGYPRQVWLDGSGKELIESFSIPAMAHGTPLAVGTESNQCGVEGPFLLEVGISSSYHIARFFGLAPTLKSYRRPITTAKTAGVLKSDEADGRKNTVQPLEKAHHFKSLSNPSAAIRETINSALRTAGLLNRD